MEILDQVRLISNNTNVALIELLIDKTKKELEILTNRIYVNVLDDLCVDIVVVKLNKIGSEGIASQGYSGTSESFTEGYPKDIQAKINKLKKVKFL